MRFRSAGEGADRLQPWNAGLNSFCVARCGRTTCKNGSNFFFAQRVVTACVARFILAHSQSSDFAMRLECRRAGRSTPAMERRFEFILCGKMWLHDMQKRP